MIMKKLFCMLLLTTALAHSQTTVWQTRMIQSQIGGATGIPELVSNRGSSPSLPIGENGSRFELWGWKFVDGQLVSEELLDSTEVGTYLPTAEVYISSADTYNGFHRCRVDQPFTVTIDVQNLIDASIPDAPDASKRVLVEHWVDLYAAGTYDGDSVESSTLVRDFYITADEPRQTFTFPVTNIVAPDIARRSGRERFIVYALADAEAPLREIASNSITMLPIPEGYISGSDLDSVHKAMPDFDATVYRAYPGGSTWVEVYDGSFDEGERGTQLGTTFEASGYNYSVPLNQLNFRDFPISVQPRFSGSKTIVLRTSSPFPGESIGEGGIILDYKTIAVENTLKVNGMLTDM